MLNKKVLACLEQHMEGVDRLQNLIKYSGRLTYSDLMLQINLDHFEGYEFLLPVMLMSGQDYVIDRAYARLFLELFREKLCSTNPRELVERVARVLGEEHEAFKRCRQRLQKLKKQTKA